MDKHTRASLIQNTDRPDSISARSQCSKEFCNTIPRKRTLRTTIGMSALCQKLFRHLVGNAAAAMGERQQPAHGSRISLETDRRTLFPRTGFNHDRTEIGRA